MQNEVQLIVKSGGIVTTEYTVTFANCPTSEIVCFLNKIDIGAVTPTLSNEIWQQLADEGGTIDLYDGSDNYLTSLTISSFNGTDIIYFDTNILCALAEGVACYFKFSLDVNGTIEYFLDLYPNESISLSYQFTDLNNFSQMGTFSRDFRIPATKRNIEALGPLYDYNFVDDVQSFSRKYTAELRVDTIPISQGYIRVMAAYKQQDFLSDFQVAFYSEAPNFVKAIGEKKLADITDLQNQTENVVFPNVTVQNSFRIWSLIDRAQGGKAFSEAGEINTRRINDVGGIPIYAGDLTPCVRADYLLTEIFNDAGYELDASSLLNIIQDYYVPFINTESLNFAQSSSDYGLRVNNSTAITSGITIGNTVFPFDTEVFDSALVFDPVTYTYTASATGFYSFNLRTALSSVNKISGVSFLIRITDLSAFTTDVAFTGIINPTDGVYSIVTPTFFMATGYTFQVYYRHSTYISVAPGSPSITYDANGTFMELNTLQFLSNVDISYPANAPDVKQIDFVSDIIKMHNLAIVPNAAIENKLKLEPMTTFIGSGTTLDWSKKLDISKDIVIKGTDDLRKTKLTFTYSAGQDTYSKLFVDQGRIYGDYQPEPYLVTATQEPSEFAQGETTVKLVAQSTPATLVNGTNAICPRFWTQSGGDPPKFTAPGLRFLYYSDNANVYLFDEVSGFGVSQSVPIVTHYSDTSGFNPDYNNLDLNFAPETPLHDYTSNPFYNLFTLYWRDYLDTIYSDDARMLEASFALDNTDILTLNFGDYIFVKDAYWRVIELSDYKMGQYESTRVKLLKMNPGAEPKPGCDIVPVSVNPDGTVQFETPGGSPVSASETCCKAYNYTWSSDTGLCYARPSDRPSVDKPNNDSSGKGEITGINTISAGANNINTTINLNAGSSTFSVYSGKDIIVQDQNDNLIAVGDTIKLVGEHRGAAMFGKSVESAVPGLVVGGGWPQDDRTYAFNGSQSAGTFMMSEQGTYAATLGTLELFIEGIANKRIELEDTTAWYMRMQVMVQPTINQYINATITAQIGKTAGVAFATAPIVQYQDTSMAGRTVALIIDTATNTAQHRMNIQLAGGTYPFITRLVAQINYTQFR
jgi:hypothetical protein